MTDRHDGDDDALAFLEGRLDNDRSLALAERLAARPDEAAALMADARDIAALRLALDLPDTPPRRLEEAAQSLQRLLDRQRLLNRVRPVAAAICLFMAGWGGHAAWQMHNAPRTPSLVEAALDARAAMDIRRWMASQPESTLLDPQEILAATGVTLPQIPANWILRDAQIVATPDRPGVALSLDTPDLGPIMLLAVARPSHDRLDPPTAFDRDGMTFALFEGSTAAFVLLDMSGHPDQLARSADMLLASIE